MKIKQVIAETGLTDRAIRLYIENDLVKPECDENYNGRKSIDFSENDVKQLKDIALLRKADFSIQEIKALQMGGETAQNTIKEYINRTNEKIQFNTEIIKKIGALADEENVTTEMICKRLSSNLENEKVPAEDMEPPTKEKVVRAIFIIISVVGMTLSVLFTLFIAWYYNYEFLYPKFYDDFFVAWRAIPIRMLFIIQFALCLTTFLLSKKTNNIRKKKNKRIIAVIILIFVWGLSWLALPQKMTFTVFAHPIYSQTENPTDYLVLDNYVRGAFGDDIYEIFPTTIPDSAVSEGELFYPPVNFPKTTKYYYIYEAAIEERFDIFAEWQLSQEEYNEEKERLSKKSDKIISTTIKGDWNCVYFTEDDDEDISAGYYILMFAYNDTTRTVRYAASLDIEGIYTPHYLTQKW